MDLFNKSVPRFAQIDRRWRNILLLLYVNDFFIGNTSKNSIKIAEKMLAKRFKLKMSCLSSENVELELKNEENGTTILQNEWLKTDFKVGNSWDKKKYNAIDSELQDH